MTRLALILSVALAVPAVALAQSGPSGEPEVAVVPGAVGLEPGHPLTGPNPLPETTPADPMAREVTDDKRQTRSYPEQPPVIPHSIRDYQIDLNTNRCLNCHSREYTAATQAPMISITHYQDRSGQMLAGLAPRRYVCTACHVQQTAVQPPVDNTFTEVRTMSTLPSRGTTGGREERP